MIDEFVTYEQAKTLIDDLGFRFYDDSCYMKCHGEAWDISLSHEVNYPMPLKQQAFRWFRERHVFYVNMVDSNLFYFVIHLKKGEIKNPGEIFISNHFETHEETEDACINKLIELIKENNNE